jgi:uncharacterized protein YebE (UPF0316 family)
MDLILTPEALLLAAIIFALRALNQSMDTIRILVMMRGRKLVAWLLGFTQSVIFILTLGRVINDLDNLLNIFVYAAGFASGNVFGIWLEGRLAFGYFNVRIVSPRRGTTIVERLREEGYAVTEIPARGKDGAVSLLNASVRRRDVHKIRKIVEEVDENAFITGEEMRPLLRGFWRRSK